ncbi:MAG: hypothetical protein QNJ51_22565 [Calothrix sp. MO_167.B12]|nr:hypothetical protein [Calothrix sp. MO_167.B12]
MVISATAIATTELAKAIAQNKLSTDKLKISSPVIICIVLAACHATGSKANLPTCHAHTIRVK